MFDNFEPEYVKPTPQQVFALLQDWHRQEWAIDYGEESFEKLSMETTVSEWRNQCDLGGWRALGRQFNKCWGISVSAKDWHSVFNPQSERTMRDVCEFLASRVEFPRVAPARVLGRECVPAGTFLTIRALLEKGGADVSSIAPSTPLADYTRRHFDVFWGTIAQLAPKALPNASSEMGVFAKYNGISLLLGILAAVFSAVIQEITESMSPCILFLIPGMIGILLIFQGLIGAIVCILFVPAPELQFGELRTFRDLAEYVSARIADDQSGVQPAV